MEIKPNMAEVSGNLRIVHNGVVFGHFKRLNSKPVNNSSIYILFMEVICGIVSKENKLLTEVLAWTRRMPFFFLFQAIAMIR